MKDRRREPAARTSGSVATWKQGRTTLFPGDLNVEPCVSRSVYNFSAAPRGIARTTSLIGHQELNTCRWSRSELLLQAAFLGGRKNSAEKFEAHLASPKYVSWLHLNSFCVMSSSSVERLEMCHCVGLSRRLCLCNCLCLCLCLCVCVCLCACFGVCVCVSLCLSVCGSTLSNIYVAIAMP